MALNFWEKIFCLKFVRAHELRNFLVMVATYTVNIRVLSLMSDFINCHVSLVPLDGCGPSAGH